MSDARPNYALQQEFYMNMENRVRAIMKLRNLGVKWISCLVVQNAYLKQK